MQSEQTTPKKRKESSTHSRNRRSAQPTATSRSCKRSPVVLPDIEPAWMRARQAVRVFYQEGTSVQGEVPRERVTAVPVGRGGVSGNMSS